MAGTDQHKQQMPDPAEAARVWQDLAERSQRVTEAFLRRQAEEASNHDFSVTDPFGISRAFMEFSRQAMADPAKLAQAQIDLWQDYAKLWQATAERMMGKQVEPVAAPEPGDRRFKDEAWSDELVYDYLKQSYLLTARWMRGMVHDVEGLDRETRDKVDFYTRQFVSAMAPSNFAATNPAVMRRTQETGGDNLVTGLTHLLEDLEKGGGRLKISMTDEAAFKVGENVAVTPGKVVYQNDLMQLIQYAASTETVHKRPLVIVPPWINKYYVLDLQAKNSFIKWVVDQGYTVFVISWVNPRKDLAYKNFEDYMLEGPLAALDAVEKATGEREINLLGFCIGGILSVATLAFLAAKGDERVKAATFLATMVDLQDVGEVSVFIDDDQLVAMEKHMADKGYLEGHHMAEMFSMMRENDLIWSFVVNNYLMGRDPIPFDLLYWNGDSTRLPATMLLYYLRNVYKRNLLMKPGGMSLAGEPIDISKIKVPTYVLATKDDHIAPWHSCYAPTQAFAGQVRFVLGASGHIAGVVNPPNRNKYGYWTGTKTPADPEAWLAGAKWADGSWWPDWERWLKRRSGKQVPARKPGGGKLRPIEDAPGSYVKVKAAE